MCRISSFGSMVDDSVSRRGSARSANGPTSEKPPSGRPTPVGPRPLSIPYSVASEPVLDLRLPDDSPLFPDTDEPYAKSEPALKLPEPTLPTLSDRYQPEARPQSQPADWKRDWSVFAGDVGLRGGSASTVADMSSCAESSVSGSTGISAPAPYSVWTPIKPPQPAPAARSYRARTLTASSSRPSLLPTVHEVATPTIDIFEFMGGYSGLDQTGSESGTEPAKPRGSRRMPPTVSVEDVPDEAFTVEQPCAKTTPKKKLDVDRSTEPARSTTPKIPGSFVEDHA